MIDSFEEKVLNQIKPIMMQDAIGLAKIAEDFDIDPVKLHALFIALHKDCYDSIMEDSNED